MLGRYGEFSSPSLSEVRRPAHPVQMEEGGTKAKKLRVWLFNWNAQKEGTLTDVVNVPDAFQISCGWSITSSTDADRQSRGTEANRIPEHRVSLCDCGTRSVRC